MTKLLSLVVCFELSSVGYVVTLSFRILLCILLTFKTFSRSEKRPFFACFYFKHTVFFSEFSHQAAVWQSTNVERAVYHM